MNRSILFGAALAAACGSASLAQQAGVSSPFAGPQAAARPLMQGETVIDGRGTEVGKIANLQPTAQGGTVDVALAGSAKEVAIPAWRVVQTSAGEAVALMSADQLRQMASGGNLAHG